MGVKCFDIDCVLCGFTGEVFIKDKELIQCPECRTIVSPKPSAPRVSLDPVSGDFPSATAQFNRIHVQAAKDAESKSYYEP